MKLGIFAKTFARPSLPAVFDAAGAHGFRYVQFNLACVGLPTLPEHIPAGLCELIATESRARGITIAAVSGTFNLIHPDRKRRDENFHRLRTLAEGCQAMGTSIITLCTGTYDSDDMWRAHPRNHSAEAWTDAVQSMQRALEITAPTAVTLAFEPEPANVVDTAEKAVRLLEEIGSSRLKVVFDGANLVQGQPDVAQETVLERSLNLLRPYLALAHAKGLAGSGTADNQDSAASHLNYPAYLRLLIAAGFEGPLIMHGVTESQVGGALEFLQTTLRELGAAEDRALACQS